MYATYGLDTFHLNEKWFLRAEERRFDDDEEQSDERTAGFV